MSAKKKKPDALPMASSVVSMPVADLLPYAANARTHSPEQVKRIAASIKEFGFNNPILVDGGKGVIAGHGRLEAARKLGLESVPVIELAHLTDAQKRAYILADNRLALDAGWDDAILGAELKRLQEESFDLGLTGFSQEELDKLLGEAIAPTEGKTDEDEVPEDVPAVAQRGQVWKLGRHRLMCGDSTSGDDFARLMGGQHAHISVTSPPYNAGSLNIAGNERTKKKYNSFDDNQTEDEFLSFLSLNMAVLLKHSDEVFYNIGLVENNKRVIVKLQAAFLQQYKDVLYWKKSTVAPHIQPGVVNNLVEFILCFGDGRRKFQHAQFKQGTYWNVIEGASASGNEFSKIHKATFPVYLPENIIENFCPPAGGVIDSFGGTGTTLIACEKTGRTCFMMELDEKYVDVIIARWEAFTGQKAELAS